MAPSVAPAEVARHPELPDIGKLRTAKADVRSADTRPVESLMALVGRAVQRAIRSQFDTNKEALAAIEKATGKPLDNAEFGKWMTGERRPQFDRLFAVEALQVPIVVELAEIFGGRRRTRIEFGGE